MANEKKILYRYRTINQHTLDELINYYFYFSPVTSLNDPFEFSLNWDEYYTNPKSFMAQAYPEHDHDMNWEIIKKETSEGCRIKFSEKFEQYKKSGVCCFTEFPLNILMWSHYSQNHTGVCIGYDVNKIPEKNKLIKVNYSDSIPIPENDSNGLHDFLASFYKLLGTKASLWCHEKEYRLINRNNSIRGYFPNDTICEIYFGLNTKKQEAATIAKLVHDRDNRVKFYRAVKVPGKFQLGKKLVQYDSVPVFYRQNL